MTEPPTSTTASVPQHEDNEDLVVDNPEAMAVTLSNDQFQQLLATLNRPQQTAQPAAVHVNNDRFRPASVGFFDPDGDAKAIEVTEGKTIYHNVFSFTSRVRVKTSSANANDATSVARNLDQCLLGKAERWYTEEISDTTRDGMQNNINNWCTELENRFRQAPGMALAKLESLRYTISDVRARKDPEEYVQEIVVNGKNAGTATTEASQVMMAYNHLDVQLRILLPQPMLHTTLSEFLVNIQKAKANWFDLYKPYTNNVQFGKQSRNRRPPFLSSASSSPENLSANTVPSSRQKDYKKSPRDDNFKFQRRKSFDKTNAYDRSRRPIKQENDKSEYRPVNKGYQGKNRKAYHANDVDDEEGSNSETLEAYDEQYYHGTPYDDSQNQELDDERSQTSEIQQVGFMAPSELRRPPRPRRCDKCHVNFASSTKYHKHKKACIEKHGVDDNDAKDNQRIQSVPTSVEWSSRATVGSSNPTHNKALVDNDNGVQVVKSQAPQGTHEPGYSYRGYRYATVTASIGSPINDKRTACADSGCVMSLIDRAFLREYSPTTQVHTMPTSMRVRGIGDNLHDANQYTKIDFYFPTINGCIAHFCREIHIVDNLEANFLLGSDILHPEGWILDLPNEEAILTQNLGLKVKLTVVKRDNDKIRRNVFSKDKVVIKPHHRAKVPITGAKNMALNLPRGDMLFEPSSQAATFFAGVVNSDTDFILAQNDTDTPIVISKYTRLGVLADDEVDGYFTVSADNENLAAKGKKATWKRSMLKGLMAATAALSTQPKTVPSPSASTIDMQQGSCCLHASLSSPGTSHQETHLPSGITVFGDRQTVFQIAQIVDKFGSLWEDRGQQVRMQEDELMEIPLVDDWEHVYKPGQARVYTSGRRDRQVIDETFDKLHTQGRLDWTKKSTPFSFPCFVVWKQTSDGPKGRVVIDIRALNKITVPDAYPIPLQTEILAEVAGCNYITTVDCASFFYQFLVKKSHRYRLTVASHRGQETFKCALMGYRNSPSHAQRSIDRILRHHRQYSRAYIDDIVIYSKTLNDHLTHLNAVFETLLEYDICLSAKKSFLAYPSVQLLGQRVDAFGLATDEEKLKAISQLAFPKSLRHLEHYLGLTGYLRQYIPFYSSVAEPLQQRKVKLYKILRERRVVGNARKKEAARTRLLDPTRQEIQAYRMLQKLFARPGILTHFDPSVKLYIDLDASQELGFGAYAYHLKDDKKGQKSILPILFLSKVLTPAETRYWPTELEVAALVWVVKKLRHHIEASHEPSIIYTDHQATIDIVKQSSLNTTSVVRLNLRHVRSSEYLSRFRLDVRHKPGRSNTIPDALSRLPIVTDTHAHLIHNKDLDKVEIGQDGKRNAEHNLHEVTEFAYPVAIVELSSEFRTRIRQAYEDDKQCSRLIAIIQDNDRLHDDAARLPFQLRRRLIYFDDRELGPRLVIPKNFEQEIFEIAHDQLGHLGYARTHERLTQTFYIFNLSKKLKEYIAHCPECQARRTPRHRPFGSLQPILSPARPFHTLTIDFIVALPRSVPDRYDCALTLTDKFTKAISIIPGISTYNGAQWAVLLLDRLHLMLWGIPQAIISDRDAKFVGELWSTILDRLGVKLLFTTAWHPSADGMSERTNQTIEIALRYLLATLEDHHQWPAVLPRLSAALGNSTSRGTGMPATKVLYGKRIKEGLDLARIAVDNEALVDITDNEDPVIRNSDRVSALPAMAYPVVPANPAPYLSTHVDAKDAIALAAMTMKAQYDARHLPRFFQVGDWVSLRLHRGYTLPGFKDRNHKIEQQFAGPFQVIEKINRLAYRLRLPPAMNRVHPVISIAHLEPAPAPQDDPYNRQASLVETPALTLDGQINRQPERLLRKRVQRRRNGGEFTQYLVRFNGLGVEFDQWIIDRDLPVGMRTRFDEENHT